MKKRLFGTDGIRGKTNTHPITPDIVLRIAQGFGEFLKKTTHARPKVIIGKDTRASCYMLEGALASGLISIGADVLFLGPIPTPGVSYLTRSLRADAGIMISASHNSFEDNGIKFFDSNGIKFSEKIEKQIEAFIHKKDRTAALSAPEDIGKALRVDDALSQYSVFLKGTFPSDLSLEGMKIVVDAAHGASYKLAPKVLKELGAEVIMIHDEPDGFNINKESGALYPEILSQVVLREKAHLGIALDGDADRLVLVDEKGKVFEGDFIIGLCASFLKETKALKNKGICITIMSNLGLENYLKELGIKVHRCSVGDKFILDVLLKKHLSFGGEQSGHLIFSDYLPTGDGMLAALKILEILLRKKKPLSYFSSLFTAIPQITKSFRVLSTPSFHKLPLFMERMRQYEEELGNKGRLLVRYSGTEAKVRVTIESPHPTRNESMANELGSLITKEIQNLSRS